MHSVWSRKFQKNRYSGLHFYRRQHGRQHSSGSVPHEYSCENISRPDAEKSITYEIAGKCCESGDILVHDALLPEASRATSLRSIPPEYGYSMASNYNRLGRPAVVFVRDGKPRLVMGVKHTETCLYLTKKTYRRISYSFVKQLKKDRQQVPILTACQ